MPFQLAYAKNGGRQEISCGQWRKLHASLGTKNGLATLLEQDATSLKTSFASHCPKLYSCNPYKLFDPPIAICCLLFGLQFFLLFFSLVPLPGVFFSYKFILIITIIQLGKVVKCNLNLLTINLEKIFFKKIILGEWRSQFYTHGYLYSCV
jgi:hypothetical protein